MPNDVVLPSFQMDCRDWLVVTPDAGIPDEIDGAPVLAMLSTAVIAEDTVHSASALITVGLLGDDVPDAVPAGDEDCVAEELIEPDAELGSVRYLLPAPKGRLALLAEFNVDGGPDPEVSRRIEALMTSFRWAA
jgi:hypothetical protein